jgi:hypothetical protein
MRRQLSKRDAAERWLKLSLYVLRKRAKARITAHLLYHQARALTLEADRASEQDQHEQT